jgi:hypothetical protein
MHGITRHQGGVYLLLPGRQPRGPWTAGLEGKAGETAEAGDDALRLVVRSTA